MNTLPSGTDDSAGALPILLRWRPVNSTEAAELLGRTQPETEACLTRLAAQDYLVWDGETIGYQSPERRTIGQVGGRIDGVRRALDEVEDLLAGLPPLVESWALRSHLQDPHTIEVLRGPVPLAEIWTRQLSWESPRRISMFMPEVVGVEDVGADPEAAETYLREMGVDVRVVVASAAAADPESAYAGIAPSATVRIHPQVPSWMMVSDQIATFPLQWGRSDLVDLVLISNASIARAMTDYFDLLWAEAVPAPGRDAPDELATWDALLGMLEHGTTIEAAGRALGLSPRTAQRRVQAAMTYYGVQSQFSLGTAWARDVSARRAATTEG